MAAAAIALNRFGLGARPGDSVGDPKRWLLAQFERYQVRPAALAAAPTSLEAATDFAAYQRARREVRADRPAMAEDAAVGSSRVDLQACKLEYSIVSPK